MSSKTLIKLTRNLLSSKRLIACINVRIDHRQSSTIKLNLLESTRLKYEQSIREAANYLERLTKEHAELLLAINEGAASGATAESGDDQRFQRLEFLKRVGAIYGEIKQDTSDLAELEKMHSKGDDDDPEMRKLIDEDVERLKATILEKKIALVGLIAPENSDDKESAMLELSAGVGGLESRIFCSELFEMYKLYSEKQNWQFSIRKVDTDMTELGEMMRHVHVEVEGRGVFEYLKFESGVHRVQRVPKTEAKGRIHTSTVGVVVVPKPDEIKIELHPKDLKIETKTSGGPGGQHANKTESAVRIVHLPTGTMVYCDDERHMHQNRARALDELKRRLYQKQYEDQLAKSQQNRKMQIGSSSRSERIRTYNFIQDRITDHRLGENFTGIQRFLTAITLPVVIDNLKAMHQLELFDELVVENSQTKA